MEKLKPFAGDDDDEDENSDDGVVRLTEKTFESYVSENPGKFFNYEKNTNQLFSSKCCTINYLFFKNLHQLLCL